MIWFLAYIGTIVAANYAVATVGIVPVGFGLMAPAAVYFVGLAFTARDMVHEVWGAKGAMIAVLLGAALSALIDPTFALASGVAFLTSEMADLAVYAPLRERRWLLAVALSNTVGLAIDSALFLWLAFGSFQFIAGQMVGKTWMTALAVVVLSLYRAMERKEYRYA